MIDKSLNSKTLSTREVAEALAVSLTSVRRLIDSGELKPIAKAPGVRGAYLFDPAEVERVRSASKVCGEPVSNQAPHAESAEAAR